MTKGGKRKGAGRPKGEPTTTVSFRVKTYLSDDIKRIVKDFINNPNKTL